MRFPISLVLCFAAAAIPGAAFAQDAHSDHQHGAATAPAGPPEQAETQSPMMQGQQGAMPGMAMTGHGKDCHCCCCEMMGRQAQPTGRDTAHAEHGHEPPSK
jgi:hypothetical protein